jgi:hypothetical protein
MSNYFYNLLKLAGLGLAVTVVGFINAIFIYAATAAWQGPASNPAAGNLNSVVFNGASSVSLGSQVITGFLTLQENVSYPTKFFIDSKKGLQLRVDSDNNESANFTLNNGSNNAVFTIDEAGLVTVTNKVTGVSTPSAASDLANKAYVDSVCGMP